MFNITTLTGLNIGQYTLKEQLGAGGMGVVYRAYQPNLDREVAIKILPPTLAQQEGYIERFTREARTAAALEHAHIVPIYDYGTQQDLSYVVMRYLTGGSLAERMAQRVKDNLPLPSPGEVSRMLKEIASALDYAHSRGVVHRDIKAGNIMFDSHGSAYLVDFGIAKLKDNMGLTSSGLAVGTPTHMSPEQWRGDEVTPATDQYALGVVIYELICGRLPFDSSTAYALMNKHLNEPPTPLHTIRPDLPEAVGPVLEQAMAKEPTDRFPTATAFANAFEKATQDNQGHATQFFTFEVRPMRLKADGELHTAAALAGMAGAGSRNTPSAAPEAPKPKNQSVSQTIDPAEMKKIRKAVEQRIDKRKELISHLAVFVIINAMLWTLWAFGGGGFPWPIFPLFGWGAGLIAHIVTVFYETGPGERMKERELQIELARRGITGIRPNALEDDIRAIVMGEKPKNDRIGRLSSNESDDNDENDDYRQAQWERRRRRRDRY